MRLKCVVMRTQSTAVIVCAKCQTPKLCENSLLWISILWTFNSLYRKFAFSNFIIVNFQRALVIFSHNPTIYLMKVWWPTQSCEEQRTNFLMNFICINLHNAVIVFWECHSKFANRLLKLEGSYSPSLRQTEQICQISVEELWSNCVELSLFLFSPSFKSFLSGSVFSCLCLVFKTFNVLFQGSCG